MRVSLTCAVVACAGGAAMGQSWDAGLVRPGAGVGGVRIAGVQSPVVDAKGDAVDVFGEPPPLLDIDVIDVRHDATDLFVSMSFHGGISAPSAHRADSVYGSFEFDVDQSAASGHEPLQNGFPPFAQLDAGVEFFADLFSEEQHPGEVAIVDAITFDVVTRTRIEFTNNGFSFSVPRAALGDKDGGVNFTTTIGTFLQPTDATDVVGESVLVPAPASIALLGLGGLVAGRQRR